MTETAAPHACSATCAMAPRTCPDGTRPRRCLHCDRWRATEADLTDHEHVHTKVCHLEPCTFRDWLCWEGPTCDARRIDWRERALKAEEVRCCNACWHGERWHTEGRCTFPIGADCRCTRFVPEPVPEVTTRLGLVCAGCGKALTGHRRKWCPTCARARS